MTGFLAATTMARLLRYGSRVAALGAAAGAGWWFGSTSRELDGVPAGIFSGVFGKVSAAALQGYSMEAPAELAPLDPGVPRVTQVCPTCIDLLKY